MKRKNVNRDEEKIAIDLPRPMPASNDCLPHAAMNLGDFEIWIDLGFYCDDVIFSG